MVAITAKQYQRMRYRERVEHLREAIASVPIAPKSGRGVENYLTHEDFLGNHRYDDQRNYYIKVFARNEFQRQYGVW